MKSRAAGIISGAAWALVCAFGLAACWDAASLNVSTSELSELDGGTDGDEHGRADRVRFAARDVRRRVRRHHGRSRELRRMRNELRPTAADV